VSSALAGCELSQPAVFFGISRPVALTALETVESHDYPSRGSRFWVIEPQSVSCPTGEILSQLDPGGTIEFSQQLNSAWELWKKETEESSSPY
jgi:hypothetical protein